MSNQEKKTKKMTKSGVSPVRVLVEAAMMIAIATVLSLLKLIDLPYGGGVTIAAMLPVIIISYRHGLGWGFLTGLVFGMIQQLLGLDNLGWVTGWVSILAVILLDYVLAFTAFGLADLFAKPFTGKARLVGYGIGAAAVNIIRFVCSFLSGWIIWGVYAPEGQAPWLYSLLYNGGYMLPNALLCAVVTVLLCALVNPKTLRPMYKK